MGEGDVPRDPGSTGTTGSFAFWSLVERKPSSPHKATSWCSSAGVFGRHLLHLGFTSWAEEHQID